MIELKIDTRVYRFKSLEELSKCITTCSLCKRATLYDDCLLADVRDARTGGVVDFYALCQGCQDGVDVQEVKGLATIYINSAEQECLPPKFGDRHEIVA